ncbi:MAG: MATE family efflux transporter, partial [Thermofilaceae archaeon]
MNSEVSRLAVPIMLSVTADSILSLASLISVSKLSTADIAAVGLASYLFFIVNAVTAIFTGGVMVTVSQALGAGKRDLAKRVVSESLSLSIIFASLLVISSQLWLKGYLYAASQGNPDVIEGGYVYSSTRFLSLPALMVNAVLSALYRSTDHPWPTAANSLISAAVGIAAIPLFTLGFEGFDGLGIGGAGLASALAS